MLTCYPQAICGRFIPLSSIILAKGRACTVPNASDWLPQSSRRADPSHGARAPRSRRNLEYLRTFTHEFSAPPDACATWRALYLRLNRMSDELMEHIHLENNVLFPRALCE
jgi:hypothetical protein